MSSSSAPDTPAFGVSRGAKGIGLMECACGLRMTGSSRPPPIPCSSFWVRRDFTRKRGKIKNRGRLDGAKTVLYTFTIARATYFMRTPPLDIVKKTARPRGGVKARLVSPRENLLRVSAPNCVCAAAGWDAKTGVLKMIAEMIASVPKRLCREQDRTSRTVF